MSLILKLLRVMQLLNSMALIMVTNALLLLQPTHTPEQKRVGAVTHALLNSLALASFTSAVIVIIYNKAAHNADHFTTAHGKIGAITYILLIIQVVTFPGDADVDFRGNFNVLFPADIRIGCKGQSNLEISSGQWISRLESCPFELCVGDAEYMVHWCLGQYMGVGRFGCPRISWSRQSNSSQQDEIILDIHMCNGRIIISNYFPNPSNTFSLTTNPRRYSTSSSWIFFPTRMRLCSGLPKSTPFNSSNVPATIFSSSAPTLANPTAKALAVQTPSLCSSSISSNCSQAVLIDIYRGGSNIFLPLARFSKDCSFTLMSAIN